jgi:glycosyltransferase involved in cell wall biosynthesis
MYALLMAMRLAWFTPFSPVRSGISAYNAELLPLIAGSHEVDVFVEDAVWTHWAAREAGKPPILTRSGPVSLGPEHLKLWRAHDFVPRHLSWAYDLVVYQLGNATCHEFMWPYLMRYPGLVVLHDGQLHHARAHALLRHGRKRDYIAEFRDAHPDAPEDLAQFVIGGLQGPVYYMWPLVSAVVRAARAVAVHNPRLADELREGFPEAAIDVIRMGVADVPAAVEAGARAGRPAGPLRFAAFGLVTQEKRIPQALRALAAVSKVAPDARLTLVGGTTDHYDVRAEAAALGIADRVDITGYVPDEDLPAHLAAADVCICLRWPTARETSASWLRCLAAGKPTIVTDLTHLVDVPTLDPRSWTLLHARADAASVGQPPTVADAVAVSIDILDEDHSLELAMRRLALDAPLRERLGRAARRYWEATATLPLMLDDYTRVLANAAARPTPDPARAGLPAHLLEDHASHGRRIAAEFGISLKS